MRFSKGTGVALIAVLVALVMAPAAAAGFKTGRYEGTTAQGEPIGFKVKKLGVKDFEFTLNVQCEDGTMLPPIVGSDGKAPIGERGRFKVTFAGEDITSILTGKVKRKGAGGAIETEATAPNGAACSGTVDWTASRLK